MPKKVYNHDGIEIFNGNSIEFLKKSKREFALAYIDPPFNTHGKIGSKTRKYHRDSRRFDDMGRGEYRKFCQNFMKLVRLRSKRITLTPGTTNVSLYPMPLWMMIISKPSAVSFSRVGGFATYEPLLVYGKPVKRIQRDLIIFDSLNHGKKIGDRHPCPDNPRMCEWVLNNFTEEGDSVLDLFMGSGQMARACKDLRRKYVEIDLVKDYCKMAIESLGQEVLFK